MINVENVGVKYNNNPSYTISDISFKLNKSDILTIIGKNGVGKTTLLKCITNEIVNYNGVIKIDNIPIYKYNTRELSKKIGVVSANFNCYQNLLVADYLLTGFANQLSTFQSPDKRKIDKAYEILNNFNIGEVFNKRIMDLSSGERQLVMIARVIVQNPEIIIFDEPMANLDICNQLIVLEYINKLSKDGYTIILTTHNPGHVFALAGKVLMLGNETSFFGDSREVMTEENLQAIYNMTVKIKSSEYGKYIVFSSNENKFTRLIV